MSLTEAFPSPSEDHKLCIYKVQGLQEVRYKASRTGPTSYYMASTKYFKLVHIIPGEQPGVRSLALRDHWKRIGPMSPGPYIMIGSNRRVNPMTGTTQRQNFQPKDQPYILKEDAWCIYHLPCDYEFPVGKMSEPKVPKQGTNEFIGKYQRRK